MQSTEKRWSGGGSWWLSTCLLTLGVFAALVAITFGVIGGVINPDQASSLALATAGTPIALGGLALVAIGGVLRYCSCSSCWDDCDWDDHDDRASATPAP